MSQFMKISNDWYSLIRTIQQRPCISWIEYNPTILHNVSAALCFVVVWHRSLLSMSVRASIHYAVLQQSLAQSQNREIRVQIVPIVLKYDRMTCAFGIKHLSYLSLPIIFGRYGSHRTWKSNHFWDKSVRLLSPLTTISPVPTTTALGGLVWA